MRRTKIVATLGPATDKPGVLEGIIKAGVNIVRLNFSHGEHAEHIARAEAVREVANKLGIRVGILSDLQGPKIRIENFVEGRVELEEGQTFILDSKLDEDAGNNERVGIAYKELVNDVKIGDTLLLDDGNIIVDVTGVTESEIQTKVVVAGPLSNRKGVNLKGGGLSAAALTEKDKEDLICAAGFNTDFIAVSFPKTGADIIEARELLVAAGSKAGIVAKIERTEALDNIDEIIEASDAIMIARGDLGVEIGDAKLVGVQKRFINRARQLDKAVITATQMMESMIEHQSPTRAEVMDVANSVLDGTDAVMLSAETAVGKYPVKTVKAMSEICIGAESEVDYSMSGKQGGYSLRDEPFKFERTDEAIAMSSIVLANHFNIKAVACLTETGTTALLMSRVTTDLPIYGITRNEDTCGRLTICRGVEPIFYDFKPSPDDEIQRQVVSVLKANKAVETGDQILVTFGSFNFQQGGTNCLRIVTID
ncbi:pyruvate kinase [Ignatzschineria rhizosphaerae]|uniref:Pyruvate kinase n=1 Tax=Ignatzschineria rhizosphaerae TaxID=2923279 RepID=A0ABY3X228_9GAMM|nr:pyruvate kinase [Ignatzschineria rhizosphaerae]UNM95749.1 pyruvate kinase [Ignatzschineria rhizosphaerae]